MYKLSLLFSLLISLTINAKTVSPDDLNLCDSEAVFSNTNFVINVEDIKVIELEEDFEIDFDTALFLPENFNAFAGKNDIDWAKVQLVELEEDVEINFDTTQYLPENFNALAEKNDLDWSNIELIELEEDVDLDFDARDYLPKNFDPLEGMDKGKVNIKNVY